MGPTRNVLRPSDRTTRPRELRPRPCVVPSGVPRGVREDHCRWRGLRCAVPVVPAQPQDHHGTSGLDRTAQRECWSKRFTVRLNLSVWADGRRHSRPGGVVRSEWAGPALVRPGRRPASPRLRNGCFWWKLPTRPPWTGTPCQVGQVGQVVGKRAEVRNSVNLQIPPRDPMSSWARWSGCGKEGGGEEFSKLADPAQRPHVKLGTLGRLWERGGR